MTNIWRRDFFDFRRCNDRFQQHMTRPLGIMVLQRERKIFRPISIEIIRKGNIDVNDEIIKGRQAGKSQLLVIPEKETLEDLQKAVKKFFYSIGDMNTYKVELNYDQIEDVIEKDFIDERIPNKK